MITILDKTDDKTDELLTFIDNKIIDDDSITMNTTHYACKITETEQGIVLDVFHRNGDLIDTYTYWNDDVIDEN